MCLGRIDMNWMMCGILFSGLFAFHQVIIADD